MSNHLEVVHVNRVDGSRTMRVQPMSGGVHVLCYPADTLSQGARAWLTWEQWDELVRRVEAIRASSDDWRARREGAA